MAEPTLHRRPKTEAELRAAAREHIAARPPAQAGQRQLTEDELVADARAAIDEDLQRNPNGVYAREAPEVDEIKLEEIPKEPEPFGGIASAIGAGKNPLKSPLPSGVSSQVGAEATASNALETKLSPQGRELERLALLEAIRGGQPRVIGRTKAGFQPNTRGGVVQKEQKILPPGYNEAVERFAGHAEAGAAGAALEQEAIFEAQAAAADKRAQVAEDFRVASEQAADEEAASLSRSRDRIQVAIDEYHSSGPRFESVGTVLKEAPGAKGAFGFIGLILGMIGGAASGRGRENAFTEAVNQNINRRARIAEEDSKRKGARVSMEGAQYAKMERAIGDAQATRALIRAMYLDEYKEELMGHMARIGVNSTNPKFQQALSAIELKKADLMKETAGVVMERAQHEDKFVPSQAILSKIAGSGLFNKDQQERIQKYIEERRKRGMDTAESGIRLMQNGSKLIEMEREGGKVPIGSETLFKLVMSNPERYDTLASLTGRVTPGMQMFLNGWNQALATEAGKAVTTSERTGQGSSMASLDPLAREVGIKSFQTRLDTIERGLNPGWDEERTWFRMVQALQDTEPRQLHDVQGVETARPVTEKPPVQKAPEP